MEKQSILYSFIKNQLSKSSIRIGEEHLSNSGEKFTIIEYTNNKNMAIQFESGTIIRNLNYSTLKRGAVKNPNSPSVHGVGYLGEGVYKCSENGKRTVCASTWLGIMRRCCDEKYKLTHVTYKDCLVHTKWHNFQNFAQWWGENFKPEYMNRWCLDKDILTKGNNIYSEQTCCFVPQEINKFFTNTKSIRGKLPIGVHRNGNKFVVSVKNKYKGTFDTPKEAFQTFNLIKIDNIKEVADKYKGQISEKAYQAILDYKVEITD